MEIRLTDREAQIMDVLWAHGAATVAEVQRQLTDPLAYTTVLSLLRTLEEKGYVDHSQEGRMHRYFPTVDRQKAQRSASRALARKLFEGSTLSLLMHLVSDEKLSQAQVQRIQELLDRSKKR